MTDEEMLTLLSNGEADMNRVWQEIIAYLRQTNQIDDIEQALAQGRYDDVVSNLQQAADRLAEEWVRQFVVAAGAAARATTADSGRMFSFDSSNPVAVRMLNAQRLDMIANFSSEQKELVRSILSRGIAEGTNPRAMAREIWSSLGLTPMQEQIVANYRMALESGQYSDAMGRALADGRYDRTLRGRRTPLSDDQIDSMVENYRGRWRAYRAETIARTQALSAMHEGSDELYRQAVASGELLDGELECTWSAAMDARTRDSHRAMNGQRQPFGMPFISGNGVSLRYPGDPNAPAKESVNCRCVKQTRMKPMLEVAFPATSLYR